MAATYEPIASVTLGTAAADIDFTSIPSTYTDLVLVVSGDTTGSSWAGVYVQINGDTGSNYSLTYLYGDGSSAGSGRTANVSSNVNVGAMSHQYPFPTIINFMSYANTNVYKTILSKAFLTDGWVKLQVSLWRSTSAITSVKVSPTSDSFASGTVAALFGIKAA